MSIEEYFGDWARIIDLDDVKKTIKNISSSKEVICPEPRDIFKAFHLCPLRSLRVVVLGQDPYPTLLNGKPVATGIAFANSNDTNPDSLSPSLDILRDSVRCLYPQDKRINFDLSLEKWEEQGVLMLNTALSCPVGKPGGHALKWNPFMTKTLTNLSSNTTGIVYVLLGSFASLYEDCINKRFNHVLHEKHPAWYLRQKKDMPSDVWREVDRILVSQNGYGIKWCEEF